MPAMTLARTGKRYEHIEWITMDPDTKTALLNKDGPAYTDEAWRLHMRHTQKPRVKERRR